MLLLHRGVCHLTALGGLRAKQTRHTVRVGPLTFSH